MSHRFLRPLDGLEAGDHACLVYDSDERRDQALLAFLGAGLERGERVLYLSRGDDDPVAGALLGSGSPGQAVVVPADDCYVFDGAFDPELALDGFARSVEDAHDNGFGTMRSAGGPPPSVTRNGSSDLLPGYERRAARLFSSGKLVSLCAYDCRCVPQAALLAIIDAHPIVVYAMGTDARLDVRATGAGSLALSGWLDLTTLGGLTEPLARAVGHGGDVSVDLEAVDFVDVACLRLFAEAAHVLHARSRRLILEHAPAPVPNVLRLLALHPEEGLVLQ
ncbi:MAG: MEDS domain-containing protein [Actinobacteria bacterium]|nr:MEDS domain-containing protein [Actinomycetota bacterium]